MLFALYEFTFVSSFWFFQGAISVKFIGFESPNVLILLLVGSPSECPISFAAFIIFALICVVGSLFLALPMELIVFEFPLVFKIFRLEYSLGPIRDVILELASVV
jgi:hypothetical protein